MYVSPRSRAGLAAGAVILLATLPLPAARAGATREGAYVSLLLKDGVVLRGMVRREGKYEIEDGQAVVFMPNGFFFIDDGARRQYFSPSLAELTPTNPAEIPPPDEPLKPKNWKFGILSPRKVPPVDEVLDLGSWDDNWNRTIKIRSGPRDYAVPQRLTQLTPYYARVDATDHWLWPAVYLTRELGPDQVRFLLSAHPDFAEDNRLGAAAVVERRFKYCDFMAQAGFNDEAEHELDRLLEDRAGADVKTKVESARALINRWRRRDELEDLKKMHNAGQFDAVRKRLTAFDDKSADEGTAVEANELRDKYKAADLAMADAARFLDDLPKQLSGGPYDAALKEAAAALRAELQPDVLPRLDAFLGQARQAERQRAARQTPAAGPVGLLSFAVTGWLGLPPESRPETAARIWHARQFLLKYLAGDAAGRRNLLSQYLGDKEGPATLDDLTRLIPLLPPPEPEEKLTDEPVGRTVGQGRNGVAYALQLPPEYRHSRSYPVLIVLHQCGETPADALKRWSEPAAVNGYILVAPAWSTAPGAVYGYSEREHAAVLDTLADLRRHFAVDSDRVFLFGWGEGGAMAFDVGLSHPDLFAGVLPMCAGPEKFAARYYRNGAYLPFYIVDGDRAGDMNKLLREQFDYWVSQYPMMWIQYKGRGVEFYGAEVPMMFDWMRAKKREFPLQQLGGSTPTTEGGKYFVTHRATDDSFYWLTTDGVMDRCINSDAGWNSGIAPARLEAKIDLENNTILLDSTGLTQLTVWLGANAKGEPMVNFDKPLTVRWTRNGATVAVWKDRPPPRSLETLLEDLGRRGDRQRVFTGKMEFTTK